MFAFDLILYFCTFILHFPYRFFLHENMPIFINYAQRKRMIRLLLTIKHELLLQFFTAYVNCVCESFKRVLIRAN